MRSLPDAAERRRLREQAGLTLAEVAELIGVDRSTVHRWEHAGALRGERAGDYARLIEQLAAA